MIFKEVARGKIICKIKKILYNTLRSMKKFAVIGFPITHSKSPQLHQAGFQELEIDAEFEAIEVLPENLEQWIKNKFRPYFQGVAVTLPHKETIKKYIDRESEASKKIGAVNTLYWEKGQIIGTNTDCIGALKALQTVLNPFQKKVLILGAGGASRAIIFALQMAQCEISLWNRTKEKAENIAQEFNIKHVPLIENIEPEDFDIIINATSIGLNEMKSIFPKNLWRPQHVFKDNLN